MSEKKVIETVGYITKEEKLENFKHDSLSNIFVLETIEAFPGYHGKNLPLEDKAPEFVFFITKQKYPTEYISRIKRNLSEHFKTDVNISKAYISAFNKSLPAIRLRACKDINNMPELVSCLKDEGIKFAKKQELNKETLIKVQRNFTLEEINDGIYKDLDEENNFYLSVPYNLKWHQFKEITLNIKNNIENNNFDAAQAYLYRKSGIEDMIRIFDTETNEKNLVQIKEKYLSEIKKVLLNRF